ncbi:uncharacterized protein LOC9651914 isoform X2 [Selaginella moellendorffii]|uniref:uncharacterized protein LOC9651914 isoform X2 n=1 Tax=Selaginella moellendorffii TaxID=88036 RepID=UPI000D1CDEAF|nr:uncharacterized protein LOC9651914 isoform X2 [Selaginella moellendorffii]|eukprot:XP_024517423.1 uncharacterized protein LOC9651914 isoform X2 [Selaginella moellendorffii]
MGCALTKTEDEHNSVQAPVQTEELCVFSPGLRLPKSLELANSDHLLQASARNLLERLMSVHSRLAAAAQELVSTKKLKKKRSSLTVSNITQLKEAIDDYLPVLLKLIRKEPRLADQVLFTWTNQEDEIKETTLQSPYYEVLSVLQLLATLSLLEANRALLFKPVNLEASHHRQIMDETKKSAMDVLFKAAEILECALKSVLPQAPREVRNQLPVDLKEGTLQAMQLQALGQTVEIQLGLAVDNPKATMAVKRRLACEELKYWQQAYENLQAVNLGNGWGDKHLLFIRWKRAEAKVAAYYFHGLILNESSDSQGAAACLRASAHFFKESERICGDFCATAPMTTNRTLVGKSPSWGPMKHLSEKISKDAVTSTQHDFFEDNRDRIVELPDFALALQVDAYQMPEADEEGEIDEKNSAVELGIQSGPSFLTEEQSTQYA